MDSGQESDLATFIGKLSQSENLSETKTPLVKTQTKQDVGKVLFFHRVFVLFFGVKMSSKSNVSKTEKRKC